MLALRTGLPLFLLTAVLMFARLSDYFNEIPASFYVLAIFILAVSIYFIFYMIYRGFDEQITDPITHTFTRQQVVSILKKEVVENVDYSIVLINIKNLSDINARYGTKAGDKVLKFVAKEIGSFFIDKDFTKFPIGHFKGGDFILGLKGDVNTIGPFVEMMCLKFDDFIMNDIEIKIKSSVVDKSSSLDILALIERLFELNESDSDGPVVSASNENISLLELEQDILYAIKNRQLSLKFQPIMSNENISQISIKLQAKNKKIIHQKSFMPVVKRLGYEREYDEIVLEKVIDTCTKIKNITFAFRLSPSIIRNRRFKERFKQMIKSKNIDASRLIVLLSEKEVYSNMKKYNAELQEYRKIGIRIVIDNIGSLNSSVEYIKRLEVDIIRLDKPFAKHLDSQIYKSLIDAYVDISKKMDMKIWIKMVDNEDSLKYFQEIGMDYIQGNIVSKIIDFDTLQEIND